MWVKTSSSKRFRGRGVNSTAARVMMASSIIGWKAVMETACYNRISSVLGKSMQLADYNEYAGSPDYIAADLEQARSITGEEVRQIYRSFIKENPFVLTAFVPRGRSDLAAAGLVRFEIVEEPAAAPFPVRRRRSRPSGARSRVLPRHGDELQSGRLLQWYSQSDPARREGLHLWCTLPFQRR